MKLRTLAALATALLVATPFSGCNAGPKEGGADCSSNDECQTGCCEAISETCSYPDSGSPTCKVGSGSVCCQYESKHSFISDTGSVYGDWERQCECIYGSCSEVKGDTYCYSGGCSETLVQNVTEASSCP